MVKNVKNWRVGPLILLLSTAIGTAYAGDSNVVRIDFNGTTLNADMVADSDSRRPISLIVHGTLAHKNMALIETLQEALDEAGRDSLAINLSLGIDDRSGPFHCGEVHHHTQEDAVAEIGAWVEWLYGQGYPSVSLIGHSRGGAQVGQFVLEFPARIQHATLLAPPTHFRQSHPDIQRLSALESDLLSGIDFLYCENATVTRASFNSYYTAAVTADLRFTLEKADAPVLVVTGSEDQVAKGTKMVAAAVENPNIAAIEIDGADHFFHDLYAFDVVDAIVDDMDRQPFLRRVQSLQALADESAKHNLPIVLFVTEPGCPFCHELRQKVIFPMLRSGELEHDVILRELSAHRGVELIDFAGRLTDGALFAESHGIFALPTLMFFGPNGQELADRMIGIANIEMYEFYLNAAISKTRSEMQKGPAK